MQAECAASRAVSSNYGGEHGERRTSWLSSYPRGVPSEIDPRPSIARRRPAGGKAATASATGPFTNMGKTISYGDLDRLSAHFAAFLRNDLKLAGRPRR